MGFFDRFIPRKRREERQAREAKGLELEGNLGGAVERYLEAGLPDDAARVLLLRADAEREFERRIAFCTAAATTAEDPDLKQKALRRKARLAFDVIKGRAASAPSEIIAAAQDLEEAGDFERAADAYALAGDAEAEVRALTSAGAIDRLEERLRKAQHDARGARELEEAAKRIADLDRVAERREALAVADALLARAHDDAIADAARRIRARLVRDAIVAIEIDGVAYRVAFGADVSLGRGDATVVIASRAVSRRHVRLWRDFEGHVQLEDLGTRNGTFVAGARLAGPVPVGAGLTVHAGGEVPLRVEPAGLLPLAPAGSPAPVWIEIAGERFLAPLGPLVTCGWALDRVAIGDECFVVAAAAQGEGGARPFLGEYELGARVELCFGDELATERRGKPRLRVVSRVGSMPGRASPSSPGDAEPSNPGRGPR